MKKVNTDCPTESSQKKNRRPTRKRSPTWRAFRGDHWVLNGKKKIKTKMNIYDKKREALVIKTLRLIAKENNYEKKQIIKENGGQRIIYKIPSGR